MTETATAPRRGRTFDQVLAGARDVFLSDGFEGASVDGIARSAGVSKATLYSCFPDKRLLFIELARAECARMAEQVMEQIDESHPAHEVLTVVGRQLARFRLSEFAQRVFRICLAERERFPEPGRGWGCFGGSGFQSRRPTTW